MSAPRPYARYVAIRPSRNRWGGRVYYIEVREFFRDTGPKRARDMPDKPWSIARQRNVAECYSAVDAYAIKRALAFGDEHRP